MEKDTRKNVKLSRRTHQKLIFGTKILNMNITDFLSELIDQTWQLLAGFKSVSDFEFERSSLGNSLTIRVYGSKRIFTSSLMISEDATDDEIFKVIHDKHIKERKLEK